MHNSGSIVIVADKKPVALNIDSILYVQMQGNIAHIHTLQGRVYSTRMTLTELEAALGDGFLSIKRGCLVSVKAIHDISDGVQLNNGETLDYAQRRKKEILDLLHEKQRELIRSFTTPSMPSTPEEYLEYYRLFDTLPLAFADIEMVFDSEFNAIDWVFRYGNPALAALEKQPLENMLGHSFSTIFPNMDSKWLRTYERATLYGETLKIIDYSPEIDTYLDIICFPTFKGHCGCILFDVASCARSDTVRIRKRRWRFSSTGCCWAIPEFLLAERASPRVWGGPFSHGVCGCIHSDKSVIAFLLQRGTKRWGW